MVGERIGNYQVVRQLGAGGMGAVYEAVHTQIGRRAAIKLLHPRLAQDADVTSRFLNEARAANRVQHPGLVDIYEVGQLASGAPFIVMAYLEGETLSARLRRLTSLPLRDALRVVRQLASALQAAHHRGVVHRDLKPDNIIVVRDNEAPGGERPKILDFGIAKVLPHGGDPAQGARTRTGVVMGTPAYMAPEQCRGAGGVTDQADVYALGVVLFQLLTGRPPFTAQGVGELIAMHIYEAPPALGALARERGNLVSAELEALVQGMLGKQPEQRPTMAQVEAALERLGAARSAPMPALPATAPLPPREVPGQTATLRRPSRSRRARVVLLLGAGLLVCAAGLWLGRLGGPLSWRGPALARPVDPPVLPSPAPVPERRPAPAPPTPAALLEARPAPRAAAAPASGRRRGRKEIRDADIPVLR